MILYILYFILGLCAGSFLNAVIWRLEKGKSVILDSGGVANESSRRRGLSPAIPINVFTRSQCPQCRHKLAWHDLVPVFSFIFLRGKCRYCKHPISWQYPLVEISTALIFSLIFNYQLLIINNVSSLKFSPAGGPPAGWQVLSLIFWLYIASALIVIFVYDLKHYIIPDKILFPAIAISIMYHVLSIMQAENYALYIIHNTLYYVGSAIGASAFFLLLVLISRGRAMGLGDVKFVFLMGLFLGWPNILVALFSAFFFGALVGLVLIFGGRKTLKSQVPFGPFLIAGTFIALFFGERIVSWYLHLLF